MNLGTFDKKFTKRRKIRKKIQRKIQKKIQTHKHWKKSVDNKCLLPGMNVFLKKEVTMAIYKCKFLPILHIYVKTEYVKRNVKIRLDEVRMGY